MSVTDLAVAEEDEFLVLVASTAVVIGVLSFVKLTTKNCKDQLRMARLPTL